MKPLSHRAIRTGFATLTLISALIAGAGAATAETPAATAIDGSGSGVSQSGSSAGTFVLPLLEIIAPIVCGITSASGSNFCVTGSANAGTH
ncbi:hypothetical protein [Nocardia sp. NPDC006630]|uniref:hypothetical protein n=1 Tax=Nocardia sp. NPDC006630 TaxID=3157181 RepID=UPI0033BC1358